MIDVIGDGLLWVTRVAYDTGGWSLVAAMATGGWLLIMACLVAMATGERDEL